ncbi:MAG: hypothetical protein AAF539_14090, partial [Planctomycetota bacterium]
VSAHSDSPIATSRETDRAETTASSSTTTPHSLKQCLPAARFFSGTDIIFRGIATASNKCQPGQLVVYRIGIDDPVEVAADALARGAAGILTEQVLPAPMPQAIVGDTDTALARIESHRCDPITDRLSLVGIVGGDGKTIAATCLHAILSSHGIATACLSDLGWDDATGSVTEAEPNASVVSVIDHLHASIHSGASAAVIELHDNLLHQRSWSVLPSDALTFDAVVIIPQSHRRTHYGPSDSAIALEKLRPGGLAIINDADHIAIEEANQLGVTVVTYGDNAAADVTVHDVSQTDNLWSGVIAHGDEATMVETTLASGSATTSIAAATAVAVSMSVSLTEISDAIGGLRSLVGRLQRITSNDAVQADRMPTVWLDAGGTPQRLTHILKHVQRQARSSPNQHDRPTTIPIAAAKAYQRAQNRPARTWCVLSVSDAEDDETLRRYGSSLEVLADASVLACADEDRSSFLRTSHHVLDGVEDVAAMRLVADPHRAIDWAIASAQPQDTIVVICGPRHREQLQQYADRITRCLDVDSNASSSTSTKHLKIFG